MSSIDHDVEVGSIYGFDTPLPRQISVDRTSILFDNLNFLIINSLKNCTELNGQISYIIFLSVYDTNYDTEMSIIKGASMTNLDDNRKYSIYSGKYYIY